jgi:hypothetical protein
MTKSVDELTVSLSHQQQQSISFERILVDWIIQEPRKCLQNEQPSEPHCLVYDVDRCLLLTGE